MKYIDENTAWRKSMKNSGIDTANECAAKTIDVQGYMLQRKL